ncbi:GPW/gp25 family protein [Mucilaginibacter sp. KACC 22063]|uniref:GPW/gp25 family protein n=1 Tax=Mucilaginibacter sp. KACC 22063 TaxID=3025666 RepID=UPI00236620F3|nr:GPW/gp25 family protein [Mucilaginibacter sp. KACC 22063]WDF54402.1 GPW/gp25 family protein [Mucilaginibacter sp. KACC 22063]
MAVPLYKKPFRISNIFQGNDLDKQDIGASISQYLELIIFTRYGEHRYMPDFGCEIWDLDFELIVSESTWEEKLRQSLLRSINKYEKRIYDVNIDVHIKEVTKFYPLRNVTEIKKQVEIVIRAKVQKTGENYFFSTALFLSPLSA